MTQIDLLTEVHTDMKNVKENVIKIWEKLDGMDDRYLKINDFNDHKKNHRFLWVVVIGLPPSVFAVVEILKQLF